jgi:hypothetical protein
LTRRVGERCQGYRIVNNRGVEEFSMPHTLTIVIPTRNRPALLDKCLESVFEHQTAIPEVIVSDNSTSTLPAVGELQRKYGFAYVRRSDELTNFEHLNACLLLPATRWMMLLHDDDELYPDSLKGVQSWLSECDDSGIVVGGLQHIDADGTVKWEAIPKTAGTFRGEDGLRRLGLAFDARSPNTIFDVTKGRQIGGLPRADDVAADYTFFCRLAYFHGVTFFRERLGKYRWGHDQGTDLSTPDAVASCVRRSAQMARLLQPHCSAELAQALVDNTTWAFFVWVAPRWIRSNPGFVADLCHQCLRLSPRLGSWQIRARREHPGIFSHMTGRHSLDPDAPAAASTQP